MTTAVNGQPVQATTSATGPVTCQCRNLSVDLDSNEVLGGSSRGSPRTPPGSEILLRGRPLDGLPNEAVFILQNYAASLLPWRTIEKNVALGLEGRVSKEEIPR